MTPDSLERTIDDRLRRLPRPAAPPTLLPRVMRAVARHTPRPWYARAWTTWPAPGRAAAAAACLLTLGLLWVGVNQLAEADIVAGTAAQGAAFTGSAAARVLALLTIGRVLLDAAGGPTGLVVLAGVAVMAWACVACGVALGHILHGKAYEA